MMMIYHELKMKVWQSKKKKDSCEMDDILSFSFHMNFQFCDRCDVHLLIVMIIIILIYPFRTTDIMSSSNLSLIKAKKIADDHHLFSISLFKRFFPLIVVAFQLEFMNLSFIIITCEKFILRKLCTMMKNYITNEFSVSHLPAHVICWWYMNVVDVLKVLTTSVIEERVSEREKRRE